MNLEMSPSTVHGDGDGDRGGAARQRRSSQLGGNIDSRQMQELPVNGRNFLDLTLLAPGNRANHTEAGGVPVTTGARHGPAQRRRHAGDQQLLRRRQPPAELRPRRDCGVPVHLQPFRRDAGTLVGRAGERHHQVGHQHAVGLAVGVLPARQPQRGGLHPAPRAAVLEPADQHDGRRPDPARPDALLLQLRVRARAIDRDAQHAVSELQRRSDVHAHAAQAEPARGRPTVEQTRASPFPATVARLPADRRHPGDGRRRDEPSGQSRSASTSTPRRCRARSPACSATARSTKRGSAGRRTGG